MFARAVLISDHELCRFNIPDHLELMRAGKTSDVEGNGFGQLHDPPGDGNHDVIFHSILTDVVKDPNSKLITSYRAIMKRQPCDVV
ncbi:hypothetical protein VP01_3312g2 [Puccinia sorghi]|uniref:Uncharacterized protein n=1 Tax=Puccinia sorghi TaxID=27349 RepID=A0A0L6UY66_9BASI|nr:hypothetical protein VP01_3312g2 [Puccinia sorghi]